MKLRSEQENQPKKSNNDKQKIVTGDTEARRINIFTNQDEGEGSNQNKINLVSEYETITTTTSIESQYFFELKEETVDHLNNYMQSEDAMHMIYTLEELHKPFTPVTIKEALSCEDKELWKKSAIAEVKNF